MATVKYRIRERQPQAGQLGTHSFFAEAVIDNEISNRDLARKVEARTGFKSYEVKAVIEALADIIAEETKENNRVTLANEDGNNLVAFYPKVSGSISDADVQAQNGAGQKYAGKTAATEDMLTADMLQWTLAATVGVKFSKQFALDKKAEKVSYNAAQQVAEPASDGGNGNGGSDDDQQEPGLEP